MTSSHKGTFKSARRRIAATGCGRFCFAAALILTALIVAHPLRAAGPTEVPRQSVRQSLRPDLKSDAVPQPPPWGPILIATVALGGIAYLVTKYVGGDGRSSGKRSRGGWVLDGSGVGQISGGSSDDEVSGGSRNFLGGGAGGNW